MRQRKPVSFLGILGELTMLKLTRKIETEIRQAGAEAYPNECCGILLGSEDGENQVVKSLQPIVNARESGEQYHRFLITAEEMMEAELEALVGIAAHIVVVEDVVVV